MFWQVEIEVRDPFKALKVEDKVGIISVQCTKIYESLTQVEVSYKYIGLSKNGDEFIKSFSSTKYKAFIAEWNSLLVNYFESKR